MRKKSRTGKWQQMPTKEQVVAAATPEMIQERWAALSADWFYLLGMVSSWAHADSEFDAADLEQLREPVLEDLKRLASLTGGLLLLLADVREKEMRSPQAQTHGSDPTNGGNGRVKEVRDAGGADSGGD